MIFKIYARYSDTCGNSDRYLMSFVEADKIETVKAVFPHGFLCGFDVEPLDLSPLPTTIQHVPPEP